MKRKHERLYEFSFSLTHEEIRETLGLTQGRISMIETKAIRKLWRDKLLRKRVLALGNVKL